MRRSFLFCFFLLILAGTAFFLYAEQGEVIVLNRTGYDIYYLYISPESSDSWGDDLLGESEILFDGSHTSVFVPGLGKFCVFDLKAVDLDDDSYAKWGLDLCTGGKIVITMDDFMQDEEVVADTAIQDFVLVNGTGFTIRHIYVSPDYSDNWEEDLLAETEILSPGGQFPITFSGYGDHCTFDIKVVDNEGDEYTKFGVDVCSMYEVVFTLDDLDY